MCVNLSCPPFSPTKIEQSLELQYDYKEIYSLCVFRFCTKNGFPFMLLLVRIKCGGESHCVVFFFFLLCLLPCHRVCSSRPLYPGAHVVPKTRHIRSWKHSANISVTMCDRLLHTHSHHMHSYTRFFLNPRNMQS